MKIIGLTGRARAGKDTACGYILEWAHENGLSAERVAFADPLKMSVAALFDAPMEYAIEWCDALKHNGEITVSVTAPDGARETEVYSGRELLQRYGTEAHRHVFGDDFWVEVTERKLAERAGLLDLVVITDARFDNEARMVRKHHGLVWEIQRPHNPDDLVGGLEAHASEAGVDRTLVDLTIQNGGTPATLRTLTRLACENSGLKGIPS